MYASLLKSILAGELRKQGKKKIAQDADNVGKDDAQGHAFVAIADAMEAVDLGTVNKQTFKNMAAGFRAAADELDKAGDQVQ